MELLTVPTCASWWTTGAQMIHFVTSAQCPGGMVLLMSRISSFLQSIYSRNCPANPSNLENEYWEQFLKEKKLNT